MTYLSAVFSALYPAPPSEQLIKQYNQRLGRQLLKELDKDDKVRDLQKCRNLIAQGADIEVTNKYGYTPLLCAVMRGLTDMADILLEKGANTKVVAHHGLTALHISAIYNFPEMTALLLKHNADIGARDKEGFTPLVHAAYGDLTAIVTQLEAKGADIAQELAEQIQRGSEKGVAVLQSYQQRQQQKAEEQAAPKPAAPKPPAP